MDPAARTHVQRERAHVWIWTVIAAVVVAWIVGTTAGFVPGFITSPAIFGGGEDTLRVDGDRFPPGTELVELPLRTGEVLRGVYVPSDPGAPVVLHLLESSGSVSAKNGYRRVLAELADSGCASLMIDYRGVGASDGYPSPTHLEEDAWAMWGEALRRAGGDPSLVVVRTISIGALAAASLVERGVRPAGWILIAPVRAETVVANFAQWRFPGLLSRLASRFFRPPSAVDLVGAVARMGPHLWVDSSDGDELLLVDEQSELRAAVIRAGGSWGPVKQKPTHASPRIRMRPEPPRGSGGSISFSFFARHEVTTWDAHRLLPEEQTLLESLFPHWPDGEAILLTVLSELPPELADTFEAASGARDRLRKLGTVCRSLPPLELAVVAANLEDESIAESILQQDLGKESRWLRDLDLEDMSRVLDLSDPSGRLLEPSLLDWTTTFQRLRSPDPVVACTLDPDRVLLIVRASEKEAAEGWDQMHIVPNLTGWTGGPYPCCELWRTLFEERGLSRRDARRQATRILLKAAGIPDRVVTESGRTRLQLRDRGQWIPVDLDWPAPAETTEAPGAAAVSSR